MAVTPQLIKELREMTGAGMMDCKKALDSTNGNIDDAIIWLRENGLSKAAKKADRVAAEGVTFAKKTGNKSVIFEVNSETDFVSKNERFKVLIDEIADALLANKFGSVEEAKEIKLNTGKTINEACLEATATIGEKIEFRRVACIENDNITTLYNHANKRISVLLEFTGAISQEDSYNIAMHVAAMSPKYLTKEEVPAEVIQTELNIIKENTEKPEKLSDQQFEGVLQGKLSKVLSDSVLFDQPFVMDEKIKVGQLIKQKGAELKTMIRFEVGEGIQKVETDFAAEVAAQLKGN